MPRVSKRKQQLSKARADIKRAKLSTSLSTTEPATSLLTTQPNTTLSASQPGTSISDSPPGPSTSGSSGSPPGPSTSGSLDDSTSSLSMASSSESEEEEEDSDECNESDCPQKPASRKDYMRLFIEDWLSQLDQENIKGLLMFLVFHLADHFHFTWTNAEKFAAQAVGKGERSVRRYRSSLVRHKGKFPSSMQGHYRRSGVLWSNEALNKTATNFVRANANVKGRPNMTSVEFCKWVNNSLLKNSTLEPGFPRSVSLRTAVRWLHHLGFQVLTPRKGVFVDGHERPDVIEQRKVFLRKLMKIGFLHFSHAPTEEAAKAFPTDIEPPTAEKRKKLVVFCHDESTFQSNDDQNMQWGEKGQKIMKPKSKGAGIMVSDFVDEHEGMLAFSKTEYDKIKDSTGLPQYARVFFQYGEAKEGYWTGDKFVAQMETAIRIAEQKYPKEEGWTHAWIFDHSSCHAAMAADALNANEMNVKPGGKQPMMHDTFYNGKFQKMTLRDGTPKGLKMVLEERSVNTTNMKKPDMIAELSSHFDFKNEKSRIEVMLIKKGHIPIFLPKYHPELNPIEQVWAQLKRYTKGHCNYSFPSLRKNIPLAYSSVSLESIRNHFRKCRHYMFAYLEGCVPGTQLDDTVKMYKKAVLSHRHIGVSSSDCLL